MFTIPGFSKRNGFCRSKSADWFRSHGLDWRSFIKHGIEADVLEATGDGLAIALVKWARQCEAMKNADGDSTGG
nr:hypothetical protein [Pseudoxanthomonas sp. LH2527]